MRDPKAAERFAERHVRLRAIIARLLSSAAANRQNESTLAPEQLATILIALANGFAIERLANPAAVPDDLFGHAMGALLRGARSAS